MRMTQPVAMATVSVILTAAASGCRDYSKPNAILINN